MRNLFADLPHNLTEELVETLAEYKHVRIERIISTGHASPDEFWYDLEEHEWVVVLKGQAKLVFEGDDEAITMKPGDYINIAAQTPGRMDRTPRTDRVAGSVLPRIKCGL